MKLRLSLIITLAFIPAYCHSADWYYHLLATGENTSSMHDMGLDSDDYPHFVYYSWAYPILKHGYFDGTGWHSYTIPDTGGGYRPSLAIGSQDRLYISYDGNAAELSYCYWDGADWHHETVDGYDTGYTSSIAVDSNGYPHISYDHGVYGPDDISLKYAFKDGTGWHISIVDDEDERQGTESSLALDSYGRPHIAYRYHAGWEYLKYAHYDGSQWQTEVVDYMGPNYFDCSIAVDSEDRPHIAYTDQHSFLRYAVKENGTWVIEEVILDIGESEGAVSLVLDDNDYPHIVYRNDLFPDEIIYMRWNDSEWISEIAYTDYGAEGGLHMRLLLDSGGNPHISCEDSYEYEITYIWYGDPLDAEEEDDTPTAPTAFSLSPAYPNPSLGSATIAFGLPRACDVNLEVFDIKGRKVATLAEGLLPAGEHSRDVSGLSSGVYLYRLTADEFADIKKMVVR